MPQAFSSTTPEHLQQIFDSIPAMLLVVDADVRIQFLNTAAREGLHLDPSIAAGKPGGEALQCVHAHETDEGCGHGAACGSCALRNAVGLALQGGTILRKSARLELADGEHRVALQILVSAGPLPGGKSDGVLLTLENVEELSQLRKLLPICRFCGAVRDDPDYWSEVAAYHERHPGMEFPQGLCPECAGRFCLGES
jgi:PAS domain-containing protein